MDKNNVNNSDKGKPVKVKLAGTNTEGIWKEAMTRGWDKKKRNKIGWYIFSLWIIIFSTVILMFISSYNLGEEDQKKTNQKTEQQISKTKPNFTAQGNVLMNILKYLSRDTSQKQVIGYKFTNFIIIMLLHGMLGSILAATLRFVSDQWHTKRSTWYIFMPFIGFLTAGALYLLARSGLGAFQHEISPLVNSNGMVDSKSVNVYFLIALLGGLFGELAHLKLSETAKVLFGLNESASAPRKVHSHNDT